MRMEELLFFAVPGVKALVVAACKALLSFMVAAISYAVGEVISKKAIPRLEGLFSGNTTIAAPVPIPGPMPRPVSTAIPVPTAIAQPIPIPQTIATPTSFATTKPRRPVLFPANPYDFKPLGLVINNTVSTPNGTILKWGAPGAKTAVFEWDEDFKHGSHYHIPINNQHTGDHLLPGTPVPEPYATIYFPY